MGVQEDDKRATACLHFPCYPRRMRRRCWLLGLAAGLSASCGDREHPPFLGPGAGGSGGLALDAGLGGGPPAIDAGGLCGNMILPIVTEKPNLYFILDRSGSMQDQLPDTKQTKFYAARYAIAQVLRSIGHRVHYGGAVFPMPGGSIEGCAPGAEVFSTQNGDPPSSAQTGNYGPILYSFLSALGQYPPSGGTPTAATVSALLPILGALPGKTVAVLATDGAPNCNSDASCGSGDCQLTIESAEVGGKSCTASFNCCDPALVPGGQLYCIDDDATEAAVIELAKLGIDTYVIGMPGSEFYAGVLDRLAIAGNTARPAAPRYYSTKSSAELTSALREIGVEVAVSCSIALDQAPPDPALVNVYFDTTLVAYDELDGWAWDGSTTVELRGAACVELKSGDVLQVQVVSGCPTVIQ
jgi:hypothetical protein